MLVWGPAALVLFVFVIVSGGGVFLHVTVLEGDGAVFALRRGPIVVAREGRVEKFLPFVVHGGGDEVEDEEAEPASKVECEGFLGKLFLVSFRRTSAM